MSPVSETFHHYSYESSLDRVLENFELSEVLSAPSETYLNTTPSTRSPFVTPPRSEMSDSVMPSQALDETSRATCVEAENKTSVEVSEAVKGSSSSSRACSDKATIGLYSRSATPVATPVGGEGSFALLESAAASASMIDTSNVAHSKTSTDADKPHMPAEPDASKDLRDVSTLTEDLDGTKTPKSTSVTASSPKCNAQGIQPVMIIVPQSNGEEPHEKKRETPLTECSTSEVSSSPGLKDTSTSDTTPDIDTVNGPALKVNGLHRQQEESTPATMLVNGYHPHQVGSTTVPSIIITGSPKTTTAPQKVTVPKSEDPGNATARGQGLNVSQLHVSPTRQTYGGSGPRIVSFAHYGNLPKAPRQLNPTAPHNLGRFDPRDARDQIRDLNLQLRKANEMLQDERKAHKDALERAQTDLREHSDTVLHDALREAFTQRIQLLGQTADLNKKETDLYAREALCQKIEVFLAEGQKQLSSSEDQTAKAASDTNEEIIRARIAHEIAQHDRRAQFQVLKQTEKLNIREYNIGLREEAYSATFKAQLGDTLKAELLAKLEPEIRASVGKAEYDRGFADGKASCILESTEELQHASFDEGYVACHKMYEDMRKLKSGQITPDNPGLAAMFDPSSPEHPFNRGIQIGKRRASAQESVSPPKFALPNGNDGESNYRTPTKNTLTNGVDSNRSTPQTVRRDAPRGFSNGFHRRGIRTAASVPSPTESAMQENLIDL